MNNPISVRFEQNQRCELEYIARKNFHKPSSFLRIVTAQMLEICKQNEGRLPTTNQLHLVIPVIVRRKK